MKRLTRAMSAAVLASAMAVAVAPAVSQASPAPTTWVVSIPAPVSAKTTEFVVPGDLMAKKSRGDRSLGRVALVDVVEKLQRQQDSGRSVGGTVDIRGRILVMKGLPIIQSDGTVNIRVAQGRGTRAMIVPRANPKTLLYSCPPGQTLSFTSSGEPICS